MLEDDIYRSSTQYRYWSYTPPALAALRANTNSVAADRVRAAVKRSRNNDTQSQDADLECLSVEEELKLIQWGCSKITDIGESMEPPIPFDIRVSPDGVPIGN